MTMATNLQPICTERRRDWRVAVSYDVEFTAQGTRGTLYARTVDLGSSGLRMLSPHFIETGTRLRLLVRPTSMSQSMLLHGIVVRRLAARSGEGCEIGLRLHPID